MSGIDRVLRSNLKLRHLQMLVALDEFRHLGRAAEFLSLSQPAVSKSLAEVERMFDLRLFVRSSRGTEPTPYGSAVVRFARAVLADYGRTRDEIEAVERGAAGRVAVGAMVVAIPGLVARAVALLKRSSARTAVSVEEGDLTRLLPRLRVGELDLFVGRLEPGYAAPDLATEALYDETMHVVVRPDHPLAGSRSPAWSDLAALPWVVPPAWASSRVKLAQTFHRHRLEMPSDVVESSSFLVTLVDLRGRDAAAFVSRSVATFLEREGLAKALRLPVPIELPPVGIITLRQRTRTPACEQMIECLRRSARSRPGTALPTRRRGRRDIPGPVPRIGR